SRRARPWWCPCPRRPRSWWGSTTDRRTRWAPSSSSASYRAPTGWLCTRRAPRARGRQGFGPWARLYLIRGARAALIRRRRRWRRRWWWWCGAARAARAGRRRWRASRAELIEVLLRLRRARVRVEVALPRVDRLLPVALLLVHLRDAGERGLVVRRHRQRRRELRVRLRELLRVEVAVALAGQRLDGGRLDLERLGVILHRLGAVGVGVLLRLIHQRVVAAAGRRRLDDRARARV